MQDSDEKWSIDPLKQAATNSHRQYLSRNVHSIISVMHTYIYHIRRLIQVVVDETNSSTDFVENQEGAPRLQHCLYEFRKLDKSYTDETARRVLAMATGRNKYLSIAGGQNSQTVHATDAGLILLTRTGYWNALASSIKSVTPVVAVLISVMALIVSIVSVIVAIKIS